MCEKSSSWTRDPGTRDQGPRDQGPRTMDQGPGNRNPRDLIMPSKVSQEAPEASQGLASQGNLPPYLNKLEPKSHLGSLSGAWSPKGNF